MSVEGAEKSLSVEGAEKCLASQRVLFSRFSASERNGHNSDDFTDFRTENGSRQGQNMALTGFCVLS